MTDRSDRTDPEYAEPSPIGAGDTPNMAGTNEQQPQLAAEPNQGIQPDEVGEDPETRSPIVSVDEAGTAGRGADGDTAARLAQKESGEF
jgi:hypothetical protein